MIDSPDAGDPKTRLVEEILQLEAARANTSDTHVRPRSRLPLILAVAALVLGVGALDAIVLLRPQVVFSPAQQTGNARFSIYLVAQSIEAYRLRSGSIPPDLAMVHAGDLGVGYVVTGDTYVLRATTPDGDLEYRSGMNLDDFGSGRNVLFGKVP
jgi:hypothetical protein